MLNPEENNKLIAEFMGCVSYNSTYDCITFENESLKWNTPDWGKLHYHTDWNWLMPVFKKCTESDPKKLGMEFNTYNYDMRKAVMKVPMAVYKPKSLIMVR